MAAPDDIAKFSTALLQFQQRLAAGLADAPTTPETAQLEAFFTHLKGTREQFLTEAEAGRQRLEQGMQAAKDGIAAARAKAAAAKAERQEDLARRKAKDDAQPAREIDPGLGAKLRLQLLEEYVLPPERSGRPLPHERHEWDWDDFADP